MLEQLINQRAKDLLLAENGEQMPITRRELVVQGFMTGAWVLTGGAFLKRANDAPARRPLTCAEEVLAGNRFLAMAVQAAPPPRLLSAKLLARFVDPLPIPAVAQPIGNRSVQEHPGASLPYYRIAARQFAVPLHRDLKPTLQWGYESSVPGPTIETHRGRGLVIEWINDLPQKHFLPIDHHLHGAESEMPEVRSVVHVHGAKAPPASDGYPEDWYVPGMSATYYYPNNQDAALLWYHDHAMGINRLNIYAGLMGLFVVRDEAEESLKLPSESHEIPLVIYDRMLDANAQLYYPVSGRPDAPWVSEVVGNVILINGKIFPYLEVEPGAYRLRVLNASNNRALVLSLSNRSPLRQIGSDQGLLAQPVDMPRVMLFPAERADFIIDFQRHRGEKIMLRHGDTEIMQFRVATTSVETPPSIPTSLRKIERIAAATATRNRVLTLNDYYDYSGNSMLMLLNGAHWNMPITEKPVINTVEIWTLINLTKDTHPIHLHLVRFQILDRRRFDLFAYNSNRTLKYVGPTLAPEANEYGWKDTVRADPEMVTRIIVRFEGFTGRYVWHCHLLEHEDNEMMRPYEVVAG